MTERKETLLWIKDLLEHMNSCHEKLQWGCDAPTQRFLADSLMTDLSECRELCERLRPARGPACLAGA